MTWAGTGVLWILSGDVPRSLGIIDRTLSAGQSKLLLLHVGQAEPLPRCSSQKIMSWNNSAPAPVLSGTRRGTL